MRGFARGRYVASARLKHLAFNAPPAMDAANLVDIRLTCAYDTGDGLRTSTYPVSIVPACAVCYGPAFCPPCTTCGCAYCETCYGQHICFCSWCGAPGDAPCEYCGFALCSSCAPEHNCEAPEEPDRETPEEPEGELDPDTGGTTWMPHEKSGVYDDLRIQWAPRGTPMGRIGDMWVDLICCPELCRPWPQGDGSWRAFGQEVNDWAVLASALAWDCPHGVGVINLDKHRSVVCVPGHATQRTCVDSLLPWLRSTRWHSCGIALKNVGGRLQGAFVDVLERPQRDQGERAKIRKAVIASIKALISKSA